MTRLSLVLLLILSAVCYQGLNNKGEALKNLEAACKIDNSSEYGRAARRMTGGL